MTTETIKNQISRLKGILLGVFTLLIISTASTIYYAISKDNLFILAFFSLLFPLYYKLYFKYKKYKDLKRLLRIRRVWGEEVDRERDFKKIRSFFDTTVDKGDQDQDIIDEQTWGDLNLDQVYKKLDRTYTSPGESSLYKILRKLLFKKDEILERSRFIRLFQTNQDLREKIQLQLDKLGRQKVNNLSDFLWGDIPAQIPFGFVLDFMALVALISFGLLYFMGFKVLGILVVVMIVNSLLKRHVENKYLHKLSINTISYLSSLIKTAENLNNILKDTPLDKYQQELAQSVTKLKKLSRKLTYILPQDRQGDVGIVYEYLNIFFLIEVRSFNSSLGELNQNVEELQKIFSIIGHLDSLQSLASYRESLSEYTIPEFIENEEDSFFELKDGFHPLLEEPVSNSIMMKEEGIVITGSNMAGKSTFLRTVGTNILFAQTIATCLASSYQGNLFRLISSISKSDNISEGKSFYYTESERLLKLVKSAKSRIPTVCIIDELLAGTNSMERLTASKEILEYLVDHGVLVIVATHDLELADILKGQYRCYHFTDNVTKNGLDFDYRLKEGVAVTSNAIKLLEYLDYPEEITERAYRDIERKLELKVK